MQQDNILVKLYQSPKTVFNTKDIALLWGENEYNKLRSKVAYYVKNGGLIRLRNGIYAKDKNYNPRELATSIYTPSYISFETILRDAGVIFQHYDSVFAVNNRTRKIKCDGREYVYRKLADEILYNNAGIIEQHGVATASKERAFVDMVYLFKKYYFDNLGSMNWEKCFELAKIYKNKEFVKRLIKYQKQNAQ
jgi:predicted transcriptional regulator of viral defense system